MRWQGQVAAARDNIREFSASAHLQSLEQPHTRYRALAPRIDTRDIPVHQGLQQNMDANYSTLANEVGNYPVDTALQYPVQAFATPTQIGNCQSDEAR